MPDEISIGSIIGNPSISTEGDEPGSATWELANLLAKIRWELENFESERENIRNDHLFTDAGKKNRLADRGRTALSTLDRIDAVAEPKRKRLRELQASLVVNEQERDSAALAIREIEVRSLLGERDSPELEAVLNDAIEAGDATTVSALLNAPGWWQKEKFFEGCIDRARQVWSEKRSPERAAEIRKLAAAVSTLDGALRDTRGHIAETSGVGSDGGLFVEL